jgi:hypothetical protein
MQEKRWLAGHHQHKASLVEEAATPPPATQPPPESPSLQPPPEATNRAVRRLGQLAARGTKEHTRLRWPFFGLEIFILKTMMFHAVSTVLNERAHFKMVIRSVPDSVSLSLGRTEMQGPATLHCAQQVDLVCL